MDECSLFPVAFLLLDAPLASYFGGFLYLVFLTTLILAVGGGLTVLATAVAASISGKQEYRDFAKLSSKASAVSFGGAGTSLLLAMILDSVAEPSALTLPFLPQVFLIPLSLTFVAIVAAAALSILCHRYLNTTTLSRLALTLSLAMSGCIALLLFNLINTFMITPSLPDAVTVIVGTNRIDALTQMALMVNRGWLPLTMKMIFVGALSFSVLTSGAAAVRRIRNDASAGRLDFAVSWGFKLGILFGAPLGLLGYWNAAIMHTSTPVLALGLMGEASSGTSQAIVSSLSPLWDVGIIGAMSLGGIASAFYLSRGTGNIAIPSVGQKVLRRFMPWVFGLLVLGVAATLLAGQYYPGQYVLGIYVLVGGFLILESVRRYSLGQCRLYVPATLFAGACYGLILYMAPYTRWYLAANFGGISWPIIGFPLLVLVGYLAGTRWQKVKYIFPISACLLAPLVILVKSADVQLVKGLGIIAIDPTVKDVVDKWGFLHSYDLSAVYAQYAGPSTLELALIIAASYAVFLAIFYWVSRSINRNLSLATGVDLP